MTRMLETQTCDCRDQNRYFFGFPSVHFTLKRNLHHIEVFQMCVLLLYKNKSIIRS
jgi:hypothetical protein